MKKSLSSGSNVLDPDLAQLQIWIGGSTLTEEQKSAAIASVIEMGLINSSHVLAVMTENTRGSQWVPYEYGRVKDPALVTLQASCWTHPQIPKQALPEYLYLGVINPNETEIRNWLKSEFQSWKKKKISFISAPAGNWTGSVPKPLPS